MSAFDELTQIFQSPARRERSRWAGWVLVAAAACLSLLLPPLCGRLLAAAACVPLMAICGWLAGGRWTLGTAVLAAVLPTLVEPAAGGDDLISDTAAAVLGRLFVYIQAGAGAVLLRAALERASAAAETDKLTGLLNRTGFVRRLEAEANRARRSHWPLAVGFLDCDNFKQVNDQRGHLAGDEVLRLTATAIAENVRNYDAAARFGGDEFVVLWPVLSAAGAEASARRLHDVLTETIAAAGYDVTYSLGVAVFERIPETPAVLDAADSLMYEVKRSGKGRVMTRVHRGPAAKGA